MNDDIAEIFIELIEKYYATNPIVLIVGDEFLKSYFLNKTLEEFFSKLMKKDTEFKRYYILEFESNAQIGDAQSILSGAKSIMKKCVVITTIKGSRGMSIDFDAKTTVVISNHYPEDAADLNQQLTRGARGFGMKAEGIMVYKEKDKSILNTLSV